MADSAENRASIIARFVEDIGAPSTRSTTSSLWTTWVEFHARMAGASVPVLPLTVSKVFLVASLFKQGGYRAFKSYLSKAKDMHVLGGYSWDAQLDLAFRKAALSVLRGLGTSRQSAPFDLLLALEKAEDATIVYMDGVPIGWRNVLVLGIYFLMREIELAG